MIENLGNWCRRSHAIISCHCEQDAWRWSGCHSKSKCGRSTQKTSVPSQLQWGAPKSSFALATSRSRLDYLCSGLSYKARLDQEVPRSHPRPSKHAECLQALRGCTWMHCSSGIASAWGLAAWALVVVAVEPGEWTKRCSSKRVSQFKGSLSLSFGEMLGFHDSDCSSQGLLGSEASASQVLAQATSCLAAQAQTAEQHRATQPFRIVGDVLRIGIEVIKNKARSCCMA